MERILNFKDARAGDIGFHTGMGEGKFPDIITALSSSKELKSMGYKIPHHTFMFIDDEQKQVVEAVGKTRINSAYIYGKEFAEGDVYILRPTKYPDVAKGCIGAFARNFNNYPYAWLQCVGFVPVLLLRKIGIKIPNLFPMFTVCSEDTIIYLRILYDYFKNEYNETGIGDYQHEMKRLRWAKKLNKNIADPALTLLACLKDGNGIGHLG